MGKWKKNRWDWVWRRGGARRITGRGLETQASRQKISDGGETIGQLHDRVVDAGGELHAYGYRFRTVKGKKWEE